MSMQSDDPGASGGEVGSPLILNSFGFILGRWTAVGMVDQVLARAGVDLDAASATVLFALGGLGGEARPSALAQQTGTSPSNISKVLSRLQAAGMVERTAEAGDLRAVVISMTADGRKAMRAFDVASVAMLNELLEGWSAADVDQFGTLLDRFARALKDAFIA